MKTVLVLCLIFSCIGCETIKEFDCETYYIPKNSHYATNYIENGQSCSNSIDFSFEIDTSMFYHPTEPFSNKISGIIANSYLNTLYNSARITWKCLDDSTLVIGYLVHLPGYDHILGGLVKTNKSITVHCTVEDRASSYYLSANNNSVNIPKKIPVAKTYKLAQPYFGGNPKSPHEIKIKICYSNL